MPRNGDVCVILLDRSIEAKESLLLEIGGGNEDDRIPHSLDHRFSRKQSGERLLVLVARNVLKVWNQQLILSS